MLGQEPHRPATRCQVCEASGQLNARICRHCEAVLGRRAAEVLARARLDRDFARETFAKMNPLGQQRFRVLLGDPASAEAWRPPPFRLTRSGNVNAVAGGRGPGLAPAKARGVPALLAKCEPVLRQAAAAPFDEGPIPVDGVAARSIVGKR
jgi:hypothetical protein